MMSAASSGLTAKQETQKVTRQRQNIDIRGLEVPCGLLPTKKILGILMCYYWRIMQRITRYTICFLIGIVFLAASLAAQQGSDSLSGLWTGDWGPSATDRNDVTVEFKWDGKLLSGAVNPGPNAIEFQKTSY